MKQIKGVFLNTSHKPPLFTDSKVRFQTSGQKYCLKFSSTKTMLVLRYLRMLYMLGLPELSLSSNPPSGGREWRIKVRGCLNFLSL